MNKLLFLFFPLNFSPWTGIFLLFFHRIVSYYNMFKLEILYLLFTKLLYNKCIYKMEILISSDHKALSAKFYPVEWSLQLLVYNWIIVKMYWRSTSEINWALKKLVHVSVDWCYLLLELNWLKCQFCFHRSFS